MQSLLDCGLGDFDLAVQVEDELGRVSAMLTGWLRRHRPT